MNDIKSYEALRRRMPLQRWGNPDEIASVISFLISTQASIVTGAIVAADGGMSANAGQFLPKEKP
jgi:NAD(P)-dependent dehydrogenase (short-subunit alcohol dehydrogenase family)